MCALRNSSPLYRNLLILFIIFIISSATAQKNRNRIPVDSVGFAVTASQMDSVITRISRHFKNETTVAFARSWVDPHQIWKMAICPHDDYAYAGWMYPLALRNIKARVVIMIGVSHKAAQFDVANQMIFGSFRTWQGPYGKIKVSSLQNSITNQLPRSTYIINDTIQMTEHSLEALIPFLQYYNSKVQIIPILIPYMDYKTMEGLSGMLAKAISATMNQEDLNWMRDIALVISNDAVHYGCRDWGGKNLAPYGCDQAGYLKAVDHEYEIIENTLVGPLTKKKVREFTEYTVSDTNYRMYQWTWCGRYAVPFGLLTGLFLQEYTNTTPLSGKMLWYSTSIDHAILPVEDIGMGVTAPASLEHWVGYVSVGYR